MLESVKDWWRGEFRETPLDCILENREFENFKKPKLRIIFESLLAYVKKYSIGLLTIVVGAAVALFIHFDSKPVAEIPNQENHKQSTTKRELPR